MQDRLVDALQEQARVDALTGLVNRRSFDEALESALTRPAGAGTALVLIDVDAFKTINDSHGHPVGDAVLVHLAGVLREQIRTDDAVLSRLGGDELAVLLPGLHAGGRGAAGRGPAARRPLDAAPPGRRHAAGAVDQPRASRTCPSGRATCARSTTTRTPRSTTPSAPAAAAWRSRRSDADARAGAGGVLERPHGSGSLDRALVRVAEWQTR